MNTLLNLNVNCHVAKVVYSVSGLSQRKGVSPGTADCYQRNYKLKHVKGVSCVTQLSCIKPVTNVKNVASNLPVGARLQNYWQTCLDLGARPKVVQILKTDPAKPDKVNEHHKLLCQSPQEPLPVGGITSAYGQKHNRAGKQSKISGVFQLAIFSTQTPTTNGDLY